MIHPLAVNKLLEKNGFSCSIFRRHGFNTYRRGGFSLNVSVGFMSINDSDAIDGLADACRITPEKIKSELLSMTDDDTEVFSRYN